MAKGTKKPKKKDKQLRVMSVALAVAAVMLVTTSMSAAGFDDYDPPSALNMDWSGLQPFLSDYPYRAVLFGGRKNSTSFAEQGHDTRMYIIYSKVPSTDAFTFQYVESKGSNSGYIRATIDWEKLYGEASDTRVFFHEWTGIDPDDFDRVPASNFVSYGKPSSSNIYFDFWYECEPHSGGGSHLTVQGLGSVDYVPYGYILHCTGGSAPSSSSGAGAKPGSSSGSGGGSSGGGSSGDGSNSGGGSSGGDSSWGGGLPGDNDPYDNDDDSRYPSGPEPDGGLPASNEGRGGTGDTGETGGTWTLPRWGEADVTGEAGGFVEMQPGGNGEWGPAELLPGGDGEWGPVEILPGEGVSEGVQDFGAAAEQGLYDFLEGWL